MGTLVILERGVTMTLQYTVMTIRHGPKYSSRHSDQALANMLTAEGREASWKKGKWLRVVGFEGLFAASSGIARAVQTAGYITVGFNGFSLEDAHDFVASDYQPTIEPGLEQLVPQGEHSPVPLFKAGDMSREVCMELCYAMLGVGSRTPRHSEAYSTVDRAARISEQTSLAYLIGDKAEASPDDPFCMVLVGHDPNIGAYQQRLEPHARLTVVAPLTGVSHTVVDGTIQRVFENGGRHYEGVIVPTAAEVRVYG